MSLRNLVSFEGKIGCRVLSSQVTRKQPRCARIKLTEGNPENAADSKEQALRNLAAADKPPKPADPPKTKEDASIVDQLLSWINSDEVQLWPRRECLLSD